MPEQKWQFEQDGLTINASRTNGKGQGGLVRHQRFAHARVFLAPRAA